MCLPCHGGEREPQLKTEVKSKATAYYDCAPQFCAVMGSCEWAARRCGSGAGSKWLHRAELAGQASASRRLLGPGQACAEQPFCLMLQIRAPQNGPGRPRRVHRATPPVLESLSPVMSPVPQGTGLIRSLVSWSW
jgi:hypothetical protein